MPVDEKKLTVRDIGAATREIYPGKFEDHGLTDDQIGVAVRELYPDKFSFVQDVEPTTGMASSEVPGLPFTPAPAGQIPEQGVPEEPGLISRMAGGIGETASIPGKALEGVGASVDAQGTALRGSDPYDPDLSHNPYKIIGGGLAGGASSVTAGAASGGMAMLGEMLDSDTLRDAGIKADEFDAAVQKYAALPQEIQSDPFDDPSVMQDPRWWAHTMSSGLGSMIPFLVSGAGAARILGKGGALIQRYGPAVVGGVTEGLTNGSLAYKEAIESGKSHAEAVSIAAKVAAGTSLTSAVAGKLGVFGDLADSKLAKTAISSGVEGVEEGLQEGIENYFQGQPLHQGVIPGVIGGMAGGGVGGAVIETGRSQQQKQEPTLDEILEAAHEIGEGVEESESAPIKDEALPRSNREKFDQALAQERSQEKPSDPVLGKFDQAVQEVESERKPQSKKHLLYGPESLAEQESVPEQKATSKPEQKIPDPDSITEADLPPSLREPEGLLRETGEGKPLNKKTPVESVAKEEKVATEKDATKTEERVVPVDLESTKEPERPPVGPGPIRPPIKKPTQETAGTVSDTAKKEAPKKPQSTTVRKKDVKVGDVYRKKVSGRMARVEIVRQSGKGWTAKNLDTGREVYIKSARSLSRDVPDTAKDSPTASLTETKSPETMRRISTGNSGVIEVTFPSPADARIFTAAREVPGRADTGPLDNIAKEARVPVKTVEKYFRNYRKEVIERSKSVDDGMEVGAPSFAEFVEDQERAASMAPGAKTTVKTESGMDATIEINKDKSAKVKVGEMSIDVPADQIPENATPEQISSIGRKLHAKKTVGASFGNKDQPKEETKKQRLNKNQRVVNKQKASFPDDSVASVYDLGGVITDPEMRESALEDAMASYDLDADQMQNIADEYHAYVDRYIREGGDPESIPDPEEALNLDIFKGGEAGAVRADALYPEFIRKKADRWAGGFWLKMKEWKKDNKKSWYYTHTPSYIAEVHKDFKPLFERARQGDHEAHNIVKELRDLGASYMDLPKAKQAELNERLIQGRLDRTRDIDLDGLDEDQVQAYHDVRNLFDTALTRLEGAAMYLATNGAVESSEGISGAADIEKALLAGGLESSNAKSLAASTWQILSDIRESKREGYIPFSRFGDWAFGIKKKDQVTGQWEVIEWRQAESAEDAHEQAEEVRKAYAAKLKANPNGYTFIQPYKMDKEAKMEGAGIGIKDLQTLFRAANLNENLSQEVIEKIAPHIETQGFRSHFTRAQDIPGFEVDLSRSIADYSLGMAHHVSRIKMLRDLNEQKGYIPHSKRKLQKYADDYVDYLSKPDNHHQRLRQMAFHWALGFNARAAFDNLTQVATVTMPWLTQYARSGKVRKEITRAYGSVLKMLITNRSMDYTQIDWSKLPEDVRGDLVKSISEGTLRDQFVEELAAIKHGKPGYLAKFSDASTYMFQSAEKINRLVSFIAAHRIYSKAKTDTGFDSALKFADDVVDKTQFEYGKYNRPEFARGQTGALFMFKSFPLNILEVYGRLGRRAMAGNKRAVLSLTYMTGAIALVAGIEGLPAAEEVLALGSMLVNKVPGTREIFATVFGTTPLEKIDWAYEIQEYIAGLTNEEFADVAMHGLGRLTPVDFGNTLGIGSILGLHRFLEYGDITSMFAIPAMGTRALEGIGDLYQGDTAKGLSKVSPRALAGPIKAASMVKESEKNPGTFTRTRYGGQIGLPGNTPPTGLEVAAQALGATPTRVSRAYEQQGYLYDLADSTRDVKSSMVQRLAGAYLEGSDEEINEAWQHVREFNKGRKPEDMVDIDADDIFRKIEFMSTPAAVRDIERLPKEKRPLADSVIPGY